MFIPQRPYLTVGTLRDQVIYPHTEMDMQDAGRRESELQTILEQSKLGYLTDREGGWDTKKVWKDVLSGGEKQRMGIARLLYHLPRYAFIDEGTSAVSSDVEGLLYETCKAKGISKFYHHSMLGVANHIHKLTVSSSIDHHLNARVSETLSQLATHSRSR